MLAWIGADVAVLFVGVVVYDVTRSTPSTAVSAQQRLPNSSDTGAGSDYRPRLIATKCVGSRRRERSVERVSLLNRIPRVGILVLHELDRTRMK